VTIAVRLAHRLLFRKKTAIKVPLPLTAKQENIVKNEERTGNRGRKEEWATTESIVVVEALVRSQTHGIEERRREGKKLRTKREVLFGSNPRCPPSTEVKKF